jgi:hypothetical protein
VEFDFLGKDSMRYQNSVEVDKQVFANFKLFTKEKEEGSEIFDQLTVRSSNILLTMKDKCFECPFEDSNGWSNSQSLSYI